MKAPETMKVDHNAIVEAVQMWIDAKFVEAERPRVITVESIDAKSYGSQRRFEITFAVVEES